MIYFDSIVLFNDSAIVEVLMNLVLSQCMLDVALFNLLTPTVVEVVNLACDLSTVLEVITLVYL
jgi:hypothetical protein